MVQMECFCIKTLSQNFKNVNTRFYFLFSPLVEKRVEVCFTVQNLVLNLIKICSAAITKWMLLHIDLPRVSGIKKKKKAQGKKKLPTNGGKGVSFIAFIYRIGISTAP